MSQATEKCSCCNHQADEHMCGDGPCYIKDCPCNSFNDSWYRNNLELEQFADIDLNPEHDND